MDREGETPKNVGPDGLADPTPLDIDSSSVRLSDLAGREYLSRLVRELADEAGALGAYVSLLEEHDQ
ncbi:MAG: hypothetical protein KC609_16085, partial [Myxococcales bacterium]|nr:hypothetical protein [Myxococcales bacterium]